jgi:hypothetical protein
MRNYLILAICVFVTTYSHAQFEQGTWMLGGNLNYSTNAISFMDGNTQVLNPRNTSFSFGPSVARFVKERLAVGARVAYTYNRTASRVNTVYSYANGYNLVPFVRQYIELNDNLFVFGQVFTGFAINRPWTFNGNDLVQGNNVFAFSAGCSIGFTLFVSKNIGIDFGYNLVNFVYNTSDLFESDNLQLGMNSFAPSVGVRYFLIRE